MNINDYSLTRESKNFIICDGMIADIISNFQDTVKELFSKCRKLNISIAFITQFYVSLPKHIRLNSTHYLIMKINNKIKLQNTVKSHSADFDFKDFMQIYRECMKEPYFFFDN